jgi:hypothetical protein
VAGRAECFGGGLPRDGMTRVRTGAVDAPRVYPRASATRRGYAPTRYAIAPQRIL